MELALTKDMTLLLRGMLSKPQILPFADVPGMTPYKAENRKEARDLVRLKHWVEDKVVPVLEGNTASTNGDILITRKLKQKYADRILKVAEYYQKMGMLVQTAEPYWDLRDLLEGTTSELEDVEDTCEE